ncbi:MAG TPA: phosphoenolpyruvate synthase [Nitrososphaeraceae archaeon]|nr:phosphoenolpyruvate synthase [Nitrososphaeraceae archaeon]
MTNDYVVPLAQIGKNDLGVAGGKAANLGEMIRIGIPVPGGFVVTTASYDRMIQKYNLADPISKIINDTNVDDTEKLFEASRKIKELIVSCRIPPEIEARIKEAYKSLITENQIGFKSDTKKNRLNVAVRSSATAEDLPSASFAGQQVSFLNVSNETDLVESVRKCWASLFEPRAIFYRAKHGISKSSIAVVVQKMVNSEKSGIIFTIDPNSGQNMLLIEAIWGLGESIVSGQVTPDMYKVSKDKRKIGTILDVQISKKNKMLSYDYESGKTVETQLPITRANAQVLSSTEIMDLARYSILLEDHYLGHPQDIEFAVENNRIMILQTRAITTTTKIMNKIDESKDISNKQLIKGIGASPGIAVGTVRIINSKDEIIKIKSGEIIVTTMTSPDLVPAMSKSAAIVTDLGGRTCHAAIVSRELGIPAIVGTRQATAILKNDQMVTVDAYNGIVYDGRIETSQEVQDEKGDSTLMTISPVPQTKVNIKVNLAFPTRLSEIVPNLDGVGLLRIEHMIAKSGLHPGMLIKAGRKEEYINILINGIKPIASAFNPKPVRVRTLDARSDEFRNLEGGESEPIEDNPMLGWHGIRRSLEQPELLKAEFEALKRLYEEGFTNLEVMLPFVISVEEVKEVMVIARQMGLPSEIKIGVMVETPASVMIIEELCKLGITFASFGTNDLIQLILGIDRNNEKLAKNYNAFHPAVLDSLKKVIDVCNKFGIESSICGESGSCPEMARILVGYGIKSISCNIDAIDTIRNVVFEEEGKTKASMKHDQYSNSSL